MRVILFILFLMNPLIAVDEELGILYPSIKTNIINGDMDSAQKEIEERMKKGESNSALNLYQTEIWISKADELYDSKKYKSSFEYYKLAYEKWSSHPQRQCIDPAKNRSPKIRPSDPPTSTGIPN